MTKLKTIFVFSAGGHYQLFKSVIGDVDAPNIAVSFYSEALDQEKIFFVKDASRGVSNLIACTFQALGVFVKQRPKCVVSFGAGVAIPFLLIGALLRIRIIHVDLPCQILEPSKTARIAQFLGAELIATVDNQLVRRQRANIVDYFSFIEVKENS